MRGACWPRWTRRGRRWRCRARGCRVGCGSPTTLGELCVAGAAAGFATAHPGLRVELHLGDGLTDLAAGGFDMAVRIGWPRDSSLRMARIGATTLRVAASPAYLAAHGVPSVPTDLAGHHALVDLNEAPPGRWLFRQGGDEIAVAVAGPLAVNSATVTIAQALAGRGIVRAPDIFLGAHLASGALVELLAGYAGPARPIQVLTLPGAHRPRPVCAFAEALRRHLGALRAPVLPAPDTAPTRPRPRPRRVDKPVPEA